MLCNNSLKKIIIYKCCSIPPQQDKFNSFEILHKKHKRKKSNSKKNHRSIKTNNLIKNNL